MGLLNDLKARFRRERVTLALDDIQALILRSRPEPYVGIHAMLHFDDAEGGRDLVRRLAAHIPSAAGWTDDRDAWIGAALSFQGLKALGLPEASLKTFPLPFQQGMAGRAEQLRDFDVNAPEHWDEAFHPGVCHLALTIYARDEAALEVARAKAMGELARSHGVTLVGTHAFGADADAKNPFGFRDSISQPAVAGSGVDALPGQERAIAAGEFILGENSETGAPVAMPEPPELGRNGSFVVLRKYASQVGAFNDFVRSHAASESEEELLAAKLVGRWRSGAPLILAPERDDPELGADPARNNDFDFSKDPRGFVCPHASHMRRLNPRDSRLTILTDVNIHRIIRRSSTFGPKWRREVTATDDARDERGIFFIFISARAYDTIEFLQQEWINRGNFIDLGTERDAIVGLHETPGSFTLPQSPVRHRLDGVTTFNRLKGGEYLFMPSLGALRWIGEAGWMR
ncbi:Dyp-type peroxidase [Massilia sp. YIM B02769]|uniref:Dyp-type peroxidase n=1 Tax=Massilia sp. YIM B02769 TaxID=3050129 RepID=UPI0025B64781|nr:Dyp-type peroxidase [Massilia sp. YIM B02769]MDN4061675.1 Dyp-type peroxidase [Massilia sp. YIM B02769]